MGRAEHGALSRTAWPETHTIPDPGRDAVGGSGLSAVHRRGDISGLCVADITFVQALNHAVWQADSELMLSGTAATAVRASRRLGTRARRLGTRARRGATRARRGATRARRGATRARRGATRARRGATRARRGATRARRGATRARR